MPDRETLSALRDDICSALALLTRLPTPAHSAAGARAAWAYPLAGLAVGGTAALTGWLALALGLPGPLAAGLMLVASVLATGALHEDGLADACDGLWGGQTAERRLAIMRDSRIGSYGVIALVLALGLRWSALAALIASGHVVAPVLAAAVLSRAPMVVQMRALPLARGDGLSQSVGRPDPRATSLAVALALFLVLVLAGWAGLAAAVAVALAGLGAGALARRRIGGQTGDILGATQQLSEIAALAVLAVAAG